MKGEYFHVLTHIFNMNRFLVKKVDLRALQQACKLLNFPEKDMNYIHVTGTNGKGSVCKKISSVLQASGYKTGLFISPHIATFRERIQINGKYIEKEYLTDTLQELFSLCEKRQIKLTYFEYVTLLAFLYFKEKKIDFGVIEVGMGGNLDSTNIIDPLISVITSIGMDHMAYLGNTLTEIAEKKAGIIKHNRPLVLGVDAKPKETFLAKCKEMNSPVYHAGIFSNNYNIENSLIAKKCIEVLKSHYPEKLTQHPIEDKHIAYGINQTLPCRLEDIYLTLGKKTIETALKTNINNIEKIFLDAAHNTPAIYKMLQMVRSQYPDQPIRIVCGFSYNKDYQGMLKIISKFAHKVHFISTNNPRITPYPALVNDLKSLIMRDPICDCNIFDDLKINTQGKISTVISRAISECEKNKSKEILIICGSFFIMRDARKTLGFQEEADLCDLNENVNLHFNW